MPGSPPHVTGCDIEVVAGLDLITYNELYANISRDEALLGKIIEE